ncbi:MAG: hypothetical protein MJK04_16260 [Psychrosphaera sp.]|nr:hypothetical protein [Psychrosphaera sp.]
MKLNDEAKKFWLIGAVEALTHVAAAKSKQTGQCVHNWYYADVATMNGIILGSMKKYPNSTPGAVLLALSEGTCGTYRK